MDLKTQLIFSSKKLSPSVGKRFKIDGINKLNSSLRASIEGGGNFEYFLNVFSSFEKFLNKSLFLL